MAVITVYGKTPDVGSAAFVAPNATLAGDVVLAAGSSVWYGAVVRGDTGAIRIGKNSNIQDNAVLHTGPNLGVTIGKNVSIGHSAVVHGCTVGDGALIGMHATVMNGAVVGKNAVVAAGALVLENTVVPDGMVFPLTGGAGSWGVKFPLIKYPKMAAAQVRTIILTVSVFWLLSTPVTNRKIK